MNYELRIRYVQRVSDNLLINEVNHVITCFQRSPRIIWKSQAQMVIIGAESKVIVVNLESYQQLVRSC